MQRSLGQGDMDTLEELRSFLLVRMRVTATYEVAMEIWLYVVKYQTS